MNANVTIEHIGTGTIHMIARMTEATSDMSQVLYIYNICEIIYQYYNQYIPFHLLHDLYHGISVNVEGI